MSSFSIESAGKWLGKLAVQEVTHLIEVKDKVEELQLQLEWMQCFLSDADSKQNNNALVRKWVSEISNLALEAEDATGTYILKVSHKKQDGCLNTLKWLACFWMDAKILHTVGSKIDRLTLRIARISSMLQTYGVRNSYEGQTLETALTKKLLAEQRRTYAHTQPDFIVGIESTVDTLTQQLENSSQRILVVHGMGGMGKTTLAREVYRECLSRYHFVGCAWAYVSQQLDLATVCKEILDEVLSKDDKQKKEIKSLEASILPEKLSEILTKKKYLIVLDDVWTFEDWTRLQPAFPTGNKSSGSKILITTRNPQIVSSLGKHFVSTWETTALDRDSSLKLLENKGRFNRKSLDYPSVMEVAQKMLDHCNGHPLAIVALGGVLATKQSVEEWESVFENLQSYQQGDDEESYTSVSNVLAMSCNYLHYSLKPCFLHMGHFPADCRIDVEKLYHLWIEDGIVSSPQGHFGKKRTLEDIAENYLSQLLNKGMIQANAKGSNGRIKTCSLHDLMRDKCLQMTVAENFIQIVNIKEQQTVVSGARTEKSRRLTMYVDEEDGLAIQKSLSDKIESLRSLSFFSTSENRKKNTCEWIKFICKKFKLLRVLDFEGGLILEGPLPKQIGDLLFLKYLCLRGSGVTSLPSSIKNLKSLLILDIRVRVVIELPNVLWEMNSLCHLLFPEPNLSQEEDWKSNEGYKTNDDSPLILDNLTKLERVDNVDLDRVAVKGLLGLTSMKKLSATCKEKKGHLVPFLKSSSIKELDLKLDAGLLAGDNMLLAKCSAIQTLKIYASRDDRTPISIRLDMFPCHLVHLEFWYCTLIEAPMPILEKLPKLKCLRLSVCYEGTEMNCSKKGFPELTRLHLDGLFSLKKWNVEKGGFPKLLTLEVTNCPIERIPSVLPPNIQISCTDDLQKKVDDFYAQGEASSNTC